MYAHNKCRSTMQHRMEWFFIVEVNFLLVGLSLLLVKVVLVHIGSVMY